MRHRRRRGAAAKGAYYAGPGNRFWPILARIGLTPRLLRPDKFPLLLGFGIGLTDVAKTVSGADVDLPAHAFDRARLLDRMTQLRPGCLAFNGKKAAAMALGRPTGLLGPGTLVRPRAAGWGWLRSGRKKVSNCPGGHARRGWRSQTRAA